MRQGQHNNQHGKNRQRGRGGRRQGGNPLNRVYESNGPDVKVRGTAQHVADKYQQLARDAQSAGQLVTAENYYQHAEHYLRIVAANQPAANPQNTNANRRADEDESAQENSEVQGRNGGQKTARGDARPQTDASAQAETGEPANGGQQAEAQGQDDAGWDGPQPDFLKKPTESNGEARPKRARRPRKTAAGAGSAAKTNGAADAAGATGTAGADDAVGADDAAKTNGAADAAGSAGATGSTGVSDETASPAAVQDQADEPREEPREEPIAS